eukprot:11087678-Alexandrium_andersonii.AAC.1
MRAEFLAGLPRLAARLPSARRGCSSATRAGAESTAPDAPCGACPGGGPNCSPLHAHRGACASATACAGASGAQGPRRPGRGPCGWAPQPCRPQARRRPPARGQ